MSLNSLNFVSASKEIAVDLALLLSLYQQIEKDDTSTRHEIELLDGQFGEILSTMQEIIDFAGQAKQMADMITDNLGSGLQLTAEIMKEKTRIVKTCAALNRHVDIEGLFSLN